MIHEGPYKNCQHFEDRIFITAVHAQKKKTIGFSWPKTPLLVACVIYFVLICTCFWLKVTRYTYFLHFPITKCGHHDLSAFKQHAYLMVNTNTAHTYRAQKHHGCQKHQSLKRCGVIHQMICTAVVLIAAAAAAAASSRAKQNKLKCGVPAHRCTDEACTPAHNVAHTQHTYAQAMSIHA